MKVRFLQNGESPKFGKFKIGDVKDLDPSIERVLIKRGVAELSTIKKDKKGDLKNG